MTTTIDTHYWNPNLKLSQKVEFSTKKINSQFDLRTPILTKTLIKEILTDIKKQRDQYLCSTDIPTILDTIGQVTEQWLNPMYKGRILARKVLPTITGFSEEMIDTWGFGRFLSGRLSCP